MDVSFQINWTKGRVTAGLSSLLLPCYAQASNAWELPTQASPAPAMVRSWSSPSDRVQCCAVSSAICNSLRQMTQAIIHMVCASYVSSSVKCLFGSFTLFLYFIYSELGSHYVAPAGCKLMGLSGPPEQRGQRAAHTWPTQGFTVLLLFLPACFRSFLHALTTSPLSGAHFANFLTACLPAHLTVSLANTDFYFNEVHPVTMPFTNSPLMATDSHHGHSCSLVSTEVHQHPLLIAMLTDVHGHLLRPTGGLPTQASQDIGAQSTLSP